MEKIIAKSVPGREFLYSPRSAHHVSKASANKILTVLNRTRYDLKDGEIWHVFDVDRFEYEGCLAYTQSFTIRNGIVSERKYNSFGRNYHG